MCFLFYSVLSPPERHDQVTTESEGLSSERVPAGERGKPFWSMLICPEAHSVLLRKRVPRSSDSRSSRPPSHPSIVTMIRTVEFTAEFTRSALPKKGVWTLHHAFTNRRDHNG